MEKAANRNVEFEIAAAVAHTLGGGCRQVGARHLRVWSCGWRPGGFRLQAGASPSPGGLYVFERGSQGCRLVLQLHFREWQFGAAFSIVGAFCFGLMMAPPERPMPMEAHVGGAMGQQMRNKPSQFLQADGDEKRRFDHAAADRLLLFALLEEAWLRASSKLARKQARKARASMESVMWRCQACQERASQ